MPQRPEKARITTPSRIRHALHFTVASVELLASHDVFPCPGYPAWYGRRTHAARKQEMAERPRLPGSVAPRLENEMTAESGKADWGKER